MPHVVARHDKSPKNKRNPKPSPIGNNFGFLSFGSHCWARTSDIMINSHALVSPPSHSRVLSPRYTRLAPCLPDALHPGRFRCVQNNTQLFCTCYNFATLNPQSAQPFIATSLVRSKHNKPNKKTTRNWVVFCLAPTAGLEPATS